MDQFRKIKISKANCVRFQKVGIVTLQRENVFFAKVCRQNMDQMIVVNFARKIKVNLVNLIGGYAKNVATINYRNLCSNSKIFNFGNILILILVWKSSARKLLEEPASIQEVSVQLVEERKKYFQKLTLKLLNSIFQ